MYNTCYNCDDYVSEWSGGPVCGDCYASAKRTIEELENKCSEMLKVIRELEAELGIK